LVGVLREAQAREEAGRLLDVPCGIAVRIRVGLEVHLAVCAGEEGELTGEALLSEVAGNLAGLVVIGQGQAREPDAGGRGRLRDRLADPAPLLEDLASLRGVGARLLNVGFDLAV